VTPDATAASTRLELDDAAHALDLVVMLIKQLETEHFARRGRKALKGSDQEVVQPL